MPKITIDNKEIEFQEGMTVMQACEIAEVEIPRFCYHDKLSIAGNCRMCLVEMEKSPKPIASCAMPAGEGNNAEAVLEALLSVISEKTGYERDELELDFERSVVRTTLCPPVLHPQI